MYVYVYVYVYGMLCVCVCVVCCVLCVVCICVDMVVRMCVCCCGCGVYVVLWCGVVLFCVVRCGLACGKPPPCVDSKRLRVCVQDASVCTGKTPACSISRNRTLTRRGSDPKVTPATLERIKLLHEAAVAIVKTLNRVELLLLGALGCHECYVSVLAIIKWYHGRNNNYISNSKM